MKKKKVNKASQPHAKRNIVTTQWRIYQLFKEEGAGCRNKGNNFVNQYEMLKLNFNLFLHLLIT